MSNWLDLKNTPRLKNIFNTRISIIKLIREFFWSQGFIEIETPMAVRLASQEPYLNPLPLTIHDPNSKSERFYLRTSPEFSLKKVLAAGYEKIFEIGKCFRDFESFGGNHNTEFTMIEWYRAPGTYQDIMNDTEELFKFIGKKINKETFVYRNNTIDISASWDRFSMKEVWKKFIAIDLDNFLEKDKLIELAKSRGYSVQDADAYEDVFYKIFLNEIEPHLGIERPVFVYDYPACMTSLSQSCEDARYAQRFELYIGGLEIANAFGELTDAVKQKKNLEEDREKRKLLNKEIWPVDPDFIAALQSGISPAGGIALGVDRMVLLFTEAKDLNEVIFQSVKDQINT
ncbi:MAG: EF-P lysine aminoacylase GenX [Candidatus Magasanikbacteria bacterium]|nr:EF-P lysine aminoacylase GenX [Candidatus Magasanikbacteria bacterium]